jgi:ABC-type cobalamin/Fe3+-siderophores transport system ATPase subunit
MEYSTMIILMDKGQAIRIGSPDTVLSEMSIMRTFHVTSEFVASKTLDKSGLLFGDDRLDN